MGGGSEVREYRDLRCYFCVCVCVKVHVKIFDFYNYFEIQLHPLSRPKQKKRIDTKT